MNLSVFDITAPQWDEIVRSFSQYDVYYLSGYVKAFQLHGDGEPLLFYYEGEALRGINVVMKRDIAEDVHFAGQLPKGQYFDFATPYGYGGWLLEGEGDTAPLFAAYEEWCVSHGVVSEFVRWHPVLENHARSVHAYDVIYLGNTIVMDISDVDYIWTNITSKNRNVIRKAQKNGVQIYSGRSPELYERFRSIYNETMDKDHATDYYYFKPAFYESILYDLKQQAQIFYAQLNQQTIAASIVLCANGKMHYHLSGSLRMYQHLAPTNLLLYEAALWGCAHGCRTLHLGGGVGGRADSLFQFKKAFYRGEPAKFYIGKKVFCTDLYAKLTGMRTNIAQGGFFPQYRA